MKIKEYLPKKQKVKLVQARVDEKLLDQVKTKLKKDDFTVKQFIEAVFKAYLHE